MRVRLTDVLAYLGFVATTLILLGAPDLLAQSGCWPPDLSRPPVRTTLEGSSVSAELTSNGGFGYMDFHGDSVYRYINFARLWIGGIVDRDSLVTAVDPLEPHPEWTPSGYGSSTGGSIRPLCGGSMIAYRAESVDTLLLLHQSHTPLGLRMAVRAFIIEYPLIDHAVLFDVVVTNVGGRDIRQGYVGLYIDSDVTLANESDDGWMDDMIGSLRDRGIALAFDNDGDPKGSTFNTKSPRQALGVQFLSSSFPTTDTSFNWWTYEYPFADMKAFGPRRKADPFYQFADSSLGHPPIDQDKYYVMSSGEWDYDQVFTRHIDADDSLWMYPDQFHATDFSDGYDISMCFAIGEFNLPPDSSIRFQFSTFIGEEVHRDPYITDFIYDFPELYMMSLNFRNLLTVSDSAAAYARMLRDPSRPPIGLQMEYQSEDSIVVRWDPWVLDDIDGYEIYLSDIPNDSLPYPGVFTPFAPPDKLEIVASSEITGSHVFRNLSRNRFYHCGVAHRTPNGIGDMSTPIVIHSGYRPSTPEVLAKDVFHTADTGTVIEWKVTDSTTIDHFNIYRFESASASSQAYLPYYGDSSHLSRRTAEDTIQVENQTYYFYRITPIAVVPGDRRSFYDAKPFDGAAYRLTAVDADGFESPLSDIIVTRENPARDRDILVVTNGASVGVMTYTDTITNFYHDILTGLDYEIYSTVDSTFLSRDTTFWYTLASYRAVIIDDVMKDLAPQSFTPTDIVLYVLGGGNVAYFGSMYASTGTQWTTISPGWYAPDRLNRGLFGIDSVYQTNFKFYYDNTTEPYIDSCFGFVSAEPVSQGIPAVSYSTVRNPYRDIFSTYWPSGSAPIPSAFQVQPGTEVVHAFQSAYPEQSRLQGLPAGVKKDHASGTAYAFGFHLWYMDLEDARELIDWMMARVPTDTPDDPSGDLPDRYILQQNYPNPFNPSTTIAFDLPTASHVRLEIFNILGRRVTTLIDEHRPAGSYHQTWDGRTESGQPVSSGVYFYRLVTDDGDASRKMILLK